MMTFLVSVVVLELVLEAVLAYLVYKHRHRLMSLLRDVLGTSSIENQLHSLSLEQEKIRRMVRRIRKTQRQKNGRVT